MNEDDELEPPAPALQGLPPVEVSEPEPEPEPEQSDVAPLPSVPVPIDWPRCSYCGSLQLRESRRGGFAESWLRLAGCTLYRCENCERRFAFATLGHPGRRHHGERVQLATRSLPELEDKLVMGDRRRAFGVLATIVAALITFFAAAWLISRSERRRLEGESSPPP